MLSTRKKVKGIIMTNFFSIFKFLSDMIIHHSKSLMLYSGFIHCLRMIASRFQTKPDILWLGIFGFILLCSPFTPDLAGQSLQQTHTDLVIESLKNAITDVDEEVREKADSDSGKDQV